MNRNVYLLFCCQALMNAVMSGQTVMSALIGHALAVDKALNTLPMAIQMTAMMTASIPAGIVFARLGRKPGFWLGCAGSLAGSLTFALGVLTQNFQIYCVGAVFAGLGFGIAQHLRFAAAEVAAPEARPRAIALVMAGGVLAASGRVLAGILADRVGAPAAGLISFSISTAGVLSLLAMETWPARIFAYGYVLLLFLPLGSRATLVSLLLRQIAGPRNYGPIFGLLGIGNSLGSAAGPWFSGAIFDHTHSYLMIYLTALGFAVAGLGALAVFLFTARPPG